jgi:hypothetical protein
MKDGPWRRMRYDGHRSDHLEWDSGVSPCMSVSVRRMSMRRHRHPTMDGVGSYAMPLLALFSTPVSCFGLTHCVQPLVTSSIEWCRAEVQMKAIVNGAMRRLLVVFVAVGFLFTPVAFCQAGA